MIDVLGENISKDIYTSVKKATAHFKNNAVSEGTEEMIKKAIEIKADKSDITRIANDKANKIDAEMALNWIDVLHK